ncbi:pyruvate kinase [Nocardioidaceae bacterium]|nr:pyruvate kinase [Nocardioidaceae bacterium]
MPRAKIVCTLGPATSSYEQIRALVDAGMNVARLNFSHGDPADHQAVYDNVRKASDDSGKGVGVLVDLQGPKIRTGRFADGPVDLAHGDTFTITTRDVAGDQQIVSTTYEGLPGDVSSGDDILIDDGRVRLRVTEVDDTDVTCEVVVAGTVSNNKGINLPGVAVSVPAMTEKDVADLRFALGLTADFVALSFVRSADDAEEVRAVMREEGVFLPVIAKIEKPQALENLDAVIEAFDGVMVARGDLGVECPLQDVPFHQKRVIEATRCAGKPVIVATQMLDSMIHSPAPTRAEATDVANAVLDGADAVMLSGETSVGEYPVRTVATMQSILDAAHHQGRHEVAGIDWDPTERPEVICKAAVEVAERVQAKYLVAFTQSGASARRVAAFRSHIPVLAFTPVPAVRSQLALTWGTETFCTQQMWETDEMVRDVDETLLRIGRLAEGDLVVIVAGSPPGIPGSTNALRIHCMGDAINAVAKAYERD